MDYKGYKLLDKIILVCRDTPEHDDSHGHNSRANCYQAYLVDPANSKQLESARYWAEWTEYGPSYKNNDGKWVRDYEIEHAPVEFEFDNNGFILELLDCAGGSSQGGKLSFWNCLVKKDGKTFKIGINSDMLLDLLKNAVFDKGVCQSSLIFITQNGKVGMTAEGSDTYKQCIADRELKQTLKSSMVSKFSFGDILRTTTIEEVYLGTLTRYYTFDPGRNVSRYTRDYDLRDCTITRLARPVKYHLFDTINSQTKLSDFLNQYSASYYTRPDFKKSCPKRVITGKFDLDITQEEFYKGFIDSAYAFDTWLEYYFRINSYARNEYHTDKERQRAEDIAFYYFLGTTPFGCNTEPFDLPNDIKSRIQRTGIKYVEE
jgi:hypothetical protein